ncbi:hypothetical protein ACTFIW_005302 [Dictyostelium discoideum]
MIKIISRIIDKNNNIPKVFRNYCTKYKISNKSLKELIVNIEKTNNINNNNNNNNKNILKKRYKIKEEQYESYRNSWFDFEGFEKIPTITSGITSLDYQLQIGGLPLNHIIEIYGDSSTGKSTLSMFILSNLIKNNKSKQQEQQEQSSSSPSLSSSQEENVLYIDSENSFNSEWASKIGMNLSNCTVFQPNNSEEAFELIKKSLKNQIFKVIILDSLSSLMSIKDIESNLVENHYQNIGFDWITSNLNEISNLLIDSNCCFIFTNQMRYSFNKDNKDDHDNNLIITNYNDNDNDNNNNNNNLNGGSGGSSGQLLSFANSTLNQWVDIGIELKKDRFLVDPLNNIIGIKTFLTIKKNTLENHENNINNKKFQKQLIKFQPFIDIHFENGILKENEFNQIKNHLNLDNLKNINHLRDNLFNNNNNNNNIK